MLVILLLGMGLLVENVHEYHVGAVAQLGERSVRNAEAEGSTPFRSTL